MEDYLNRITDYLRANPVSLSHENRDGRVNSIANEDEIIDRLELVFSNFLDRPEARSWYDFKIIAPYGGQLYVNLKVSDLSIRTADNLSSKIGMGYALTGRDDLSSSWNDFNANVKKYLTTGYDYYFLIVNKKNTSDVFWTSLKRINRLVPNGNNLPFQCDWSQERTWNHRSELEAIDYILEIYCESWDKKISGYPEEIRSFLDRGGAKYLLN